jgi:hypothetical protein
MLVLETAKPRDIKEQTISRVMNSGGLLLVSMDGDEIQIGRKMNENLLGWLAFHPSLESLMTRITVMPARKPRDPTLKPRSEGIEEMARDLDCNPDKEAFKANLALLLRHRPKVEPKKAGEWPVIAA